MAHNVAQEKTDKADYSNKIKFQKSIKKEFKHLTTVSDKFFNYDFIKTQAEEVIRYLERLKFSPFRAWEAHIKKEINDVFLYDFYLKKNEFGELELDEERLMKLILPDEVEDPQ